MTQESSSHGGDLERRVTALESDVARIAGDAAAARALAAGADREVSEVRVELRAHRQLLNALHETQSDMQREMRAAFGQVDQRFGWVDQQLADVRAEMRAGFSAIGATLERIIAAEG